MNERVLRPILGVILGNLMINYIRFPQISPDVQVSKAVDEILKFTTSNREKVKVKYKNLMSIYDKKPMSEFLNELQNEAETAHDEHGIVATTQAYRDDDTGFMIKIEYGYYLGEE